MIELHPHLGEKLGLGWGKAPYISVTDCRLRGQMSGSGVKMSVPSPTKFAGHPSLG